MGSKLGACIVKFLLLTIAYKQRAVETVAVNMDLVLQMYRTTENSHYAAGTCVMQSLDDNAPGLIVQETIEQILACIPA